MIGESMSDSSDAMHTLVLGGLKYDIARNELRDGADERAHLRAQSAKVLSHLAQNAGELVERDVLIEVVWGNIAVTDDSLTPTLNIRNSNGAIFSVTEKGDVSGQPVIDLEYIESIEF